MNIKKDFNVMCDLSVCYDMTLGKLQFSAENSEMNIGSFKPYSDYIYK